MALKEKTVIIADAGRDHGKQYHIVEMPAYQSERWARRALAAMVKSGVEVPENIRGMGFVGVFAMGLKAVLGALSGPEADELNDELLARIEYIPDPGHPEVKRRLVESGTFRKSVSLDTDVEEVTTYNTLRDALIELQTGFSIAAYLSERWKAAQQAMTAVTSVVTSTSPNPSESSSPQS